MTRKQITVAIAWSAGVFAGFLAVRTIARSAVLLDI